MTEAHGGHDKEAMFKIYFAIFIALSIFTAVSFIVNQFVHEKLMAFLLILGVAVVKASLVGMYFMHLKHDWGRLYFIIIPVSIMGILMMTVLMPDIVLAWHNE